MLLKSIQYLLLFGLVFLRSDQPKWAQKPPKPDKEVMYFVGSSSGHFSRDEAIKSATDHAIAQRKKPDGYL